MKTTRRYDIDWLRVIAIWLLLIYHIAIVFQPWAMFFGFIRSNELLVNLWKPMTMLNVWRIPILFYVSGMGVYFAIMKRNWKQLLLERSKRILLPFLFGFFAITPLHMFIFQDYYEMPLGYFPHTGHLWFLGNIFCYVLLASPLFFYLKKNTTSRFTKGLISLMRHPLGPLSITIFFVIEVLIVKPDLFELYAETLHGFFLGLFAFIFGFLFVYAGKTFWETVEKWRWLYIGLAAILYTLRLTIFEPAPLSYLTALESNLWIFALFGMGYKYLNRPSSFLSYLSQAAYPVYIIHMFVLYAGAYLVLPLEIPVLLKFILVVAFTMIMCYLIYEILIKRIGIFKSLFGLNWKAGNPPAKKDTKAVRPKAEVIA